MVCLRKMNSSDLALFKKWLTAPHVARWYHHPLDWIDEIEKQDTAFHWIHHYIAEVDGVPIGFCQYYACKDSDETWSGYTALGGSYSIDYMIGEPHALRHGYGNQIVGALTEKIRLHKDAERIVVQPEEKNKASCRLLEHCGFLFDLNNSIYVKTLK